jgi:hypothetical protein
MVTSIDRCSRGGSGSGARAGSVRMVLASSGLAQANGGVAAILPVGGSNRNDIAARFHLQVSSTKSRSVREFGHCLFLKS